MAWPCASLSSLVHLSWREPLGHTCVICFRSGLARVLTLCPQGLGRGGGVSQSCSSVQRALPAESGQEHDPAPHRLLRNCRSVYTPGRLSRKVESWLGLRGAVRGQGVCAGNGQAWRESTKRAEMRVLGPLGWKGWEGPSMCPLGPFSPLKKERAGNTDFSSDLLQMSSSLGVEQVHVFRNQSYLAQMQIHSLASLLSTSYVSDSVLGARDAEGTRQTQALPLYHSQSHGEGRQ